MARRAGLRRRARPGRQRRRGGAGRRARRLPRASLAEAVGLAGARAPAASAADRRPPAGRAAGGRPRRRARPAPGQARARDRRRRRPQPAAGRPARLGQDDAGPAPARHPAAADARRGAGDHRHPLGLRARAPQALLIHAAVPQPAPHGQRRGAGGRRRRSRGRARSASPTTASSSSTSCPSSAATCSRRCASRSRSGWSRSRAARATLRAPGPLPAGGGHEPVPLRLRAAIRAAPAAARPHHVRSYRGASRVRCWTGSTSTSRCRPCPYSDLDGTAGRAIGAVGRAGGGGAGASGAAAHGRRRADQRLPGSFPAEGSGRSRCLRARRLLGAAANRLRLSGRAHDRLLRVARTIADLEARAGVRCVRCGGGVAVSCRTRAT